MLRYTHCYAITDTFDNHVWLGLNNPNTVACSNLQCQGILKWDDGSDFIYNSSWLEKPLTVQDSGNSNSDNCFYLEKDTLLIVQGDCDMELVTVCQSNQRCPGSVRVSINVVQSYITRCSIVVTVLKESCFWQRTFLTHLEHFLY